tara:strand:- start:177 stop:278 length:102 start_codon:yes stop_codon:yes gene_type:complete
MVSSKKYEHINPKIIEGKKISVVVDFIGLFKTL